MTTWLCRHGGMRKVVVLKSHAPTQDHGDEDATEGGPADQLARAVRRGGLLVGPGTGHLVLPVAVAHPLQRPSDRSVTTAVVDAVPACLGGESR